MDTRIDLDPLFSPSSVAVVGASPDSWYSSQLMDNLLEYGFDGTVYPVNPSREEAWGRTCYDDVSELPEVVDLVVVSIPREYVVETVAEAGEMGVPAALVITAGFAEADERGRELETELAATAEEHDIRVGGPNCIGLANAVEGTVLTSTCSRRPEPGSIGLVSQSGALAFTTFFERAADEDVDFAYIASTGNEADLSVTDYVDYMADDPEVSVICVYLEGLEDPRRFMDAAARARRNGTPVLVVKTGRTSDAEAATLSHTGSVAGDDDVWQGSFDQVGVERVDDIPDLLVRASAHAAFDPPESDRVCIASTSGGLAGHLADLAGERDLSLPDIDGDTERALLDIDDLLTFGEMHNPADIRGYGADVLPEITDALLADDGFDAYVLAVGLPAVDERADAIADDLLEIGETADAPVFVLWTGRKDPADLDDPQPYERVRAEMPLFYDPARCMDAVASLVRSGAPTAESDTPDRRWANGDPRRSANATDGTIDEGSTRSTGSAGSTGSDHDLPDERVLTWSEAESLVRSFGIDLLRTGVAGSSDEAVAYAEEIGYPVALKVDSPDVPHRSDADAVRLGLSDADSVRDAYDAVLENARSHVPGADVEGALVQPMIADGTEAFVGASTEEAFGPTVTVGAGGTLVEAFDDAVVRIPPVTREEAREAIDETELSRLLEGYRGEEPGDVEALASLLESVSRLASEVPAIEELDLNPVVVHAEGEGVSIPDVLVKTR
jgi:acetyltransferase